MENAVRLCEVVAGGFGGNRNIKKHKDVMRLMSDIVMYEHKQEKYHLHQELQELKIKQV